MRSIFLSVLWWCCVPALAMADDVISFSAKVGGVPHIFTWSVGTGFAPKQLTSGAYTDEAAEWSFDGTQLVFQRGYSGYGIYKINADGTGLTRLSPLASSDLQPSWTPDGHIIFSVVTNPATNPPTTEIWKMNGDGTGRVRLIAANSTPSTDNVSNLAPHMAPDGTTIAFECGPHGGGALQLCESAANGTSPVYITTANCIVADPHWDSTSDKVAVASTCVSGNVNVWTMNKNGSGATQLTTFASPFEAGDATWTPDNGKIAFEWDNGGAGQTVFNAPAAVWMMGSDGSDQGSLGVACADTGCAPRFKP